MEKYRIKKLGDQEMVNISGGNGSFITINIAPVINIKFSNRMNLSILVLVNDTINKPVSINQSIK